MARKGTIFRVGSSKPTPRSLDQALREQDLAEGLASAVDSPENALINRSVNTFPSTRIISLLACMATILAGLIFSMPAAQAETPMDKAWEKLEKAFNKLRDGLKDPKDTDKETYQKLGAIIKTETTAAMKFEPKMLKNVPEAERETFLANFRKDMATFDGEVDKLNAALDAGQWAEAQKAVQVLGQAKKDGHKAYRQKENK